MLIVLVMLLSLAACGNNAGQSSETSLSLESASEQTPPTNDNNEISATDYPKYFDKYIAPLILSQILAHDWNTLTDIFDLYPSFQTIGFLFQGIVGEDEWQSIYGDCWVESDSCLDIPQDMIEATITQFFDISVENMRKSAYYVPETQSYIYRLPKDDGFPVDILYIEENADYITIHSEIHINDAVSHKSDLVILLRDDGFSYVSNTVTRAPASPFIKENNRNPVAKDYCIYPSVYEVYPYAINERRIGTQQEMDLLKEAFENIKADDVIIFAADYWPSDFMGTYPLDEKDIDILLTMLKGIEVTLMSPEEFGENPPTGGGTSYYIETKDMKLHLSFYAGYIVSYPEQGISLAFNESSYRGPAPGPSEYLYQKQQAAFTPTSSAPLGSVENPIAKEPQQPSTPAQEESTISSKATATEGFIKDEKYGIYSKIVSCSIENDIMTVIFSAYAENPVNVSVLMDVWMSDDNSAGQVVETYSIDQLKEYNISVSSFWFDENHTKGTTYMVSVYISTPTYTTTTHRFNFRDGEIS